MKRISLGVGRREEVAEILHQGRERIALAGQVTTGLHAPKKILRLAMAINLRQATVHQFQHQVPHVATCPS